MWPLLTFFYSFWLPNIFYAKLRHSWEFDKIQKNVKRVIGAKKSYASLILYTLRQKSTIYPKIHIVKFSLFTKFTFSKSHYSQNSHFQNIIFHKIHSFKISFFIKFTFSKSHFSQKSHFSNIKLFVISG